jgi:hypothetical protein
MEHTLMPEKEDPKKSLNHLSHTGDPSTMLLLEHAPGEIPKLGPR